MLMVDNENDIKSITVPLLFIFQYLGGLFCLLRGNKINSEKKTSFSP